MHIFSGEKFMYSGKAAISKRSCRTERKDFIPAGTVSRRMNAISKKRFWLGPKDDRCVVKTVKKRLYSQRVADKIKFFCLMYIDRKGKNAIQFFEKRRSHCQKTIQDHFRVACSGPAHAKGFQLFAQFARVINFAIVYDGSTASPILRGHWLFAAEDVTDGESCVCETGVVEKKCIFIVWSPTPKRLSHCDKTFSPRIFGRSAMVSGT